MPVVKNFAFDIIFISCQVFPLGKNIKNIATTATFYCVLRTFYMNDQARKNFHVHV